MNHNTSKAPKALFKAKTAGLASGSHGLRGGQIYTGSPCEVGVYRRIVALHRSEL